MVKPSGYVSNVARKTCPLPMLPWLRPPSTTPRLLWPRQPHQLWISPSHRPKLQAKVRLCNFEHKRKNRPATAGRFCYNALTMAKKGSRQYIAFVCPVCKSQNYTSEKNKVNSPDKLTMSKYCRRCRKHTEHKEISKLK